MKKYVLSLAVIQCFLLVQAAFAFDAGPVINNTSNMDIGNVGQVDFNKFNPSRPIGGVSQIDWAKFNIPSQNFSSVQFVPASQTIIQRDLGSDIAPDVNKAIINTSSMPGAIAGMNNVQNEGLNIQNMQNQGAVPQIQWNNMDIQNRPDFRFTPAGQTIIQRQLDTVNIVPNFK